MIEQLIWTDPLTKERHVLPLERTSPVAPSEIFPSGSIRVCFGELGVSAVELDVRDVERIFVEKPLPSDEAVIWESGTNVCDADPIPHVLGGES